MTKIPCFPLFSGVHQQCLGDSYFNGMTFV